MECAKKYKLFRINIEIVNNWEKWIEQGIGVNRQESKLNKEKRKGMLLEYNIVNGRIEPRV